MASAGTIETLMKLCDVLEVSPNEIVEHDAKLCLTNKTVSEEVQKSKTISTKRILMFHLLEISDCVEQVPSTFTTG